MVRHSVLKAAHVWSLIFLLLFSSVSHAKDYTIEDLVTQTKRSDLKIRIKAENLFRAHQNVKTAVGRIVPGLNLGTILAAISREYMSLAIDALSFLFPSNWFHWKESRFLYQAERYSFVSLIANEINGVLSMAYRIHYIKSLLTMYESQLEDLAKIVLNQQILYETGEGNQQGFLMLKNTYIKVDTDKETLAAEYRKLKIDLANAVGLPEREWPSFNLAPIPLPDLSEYPDLDHLQYKEELFASSLELVTMDYLILASKYTLKSRVFEFLMPSPGPDANLGVGYPAYLKIQKSMTREIKIKRRDTGRALETTVAEATMNYNMTLKLFKLNQMALENERKLKYVIHSKIVNGQLFTMDELINNLQDLFRYESRVLESQHKFLISKELLNRTLMRAPHYDRLIDLAPSRHKESSNILHKMEDLRIKAALAGGKLKLPKAPDFKEGENGFGF